ncbi:hypothetical protein, partial [Pseudoflavonifractor phocaeensis]|uniref:hypothetical protein n=1 Tax=Pseudoflavonifractor phocaeensis TaxID=1870988 RepID=UPI0019567B08
PLLPLLVQPLFGTSFLSRKKGGKESFHFAPPAQGRSYMENRKTILRQSAFFPQDTFILIGVNRLFRQAEPRTSGPGLAFCYAVGQRI